MSPVSSNLIQTIVHIFRYIISNDHNNLRSNSRPKSHVTVACFLSSSGLGPGSSKKTWPKAPVVDPWTPHTSYLVISGNHALTVCQALIPWCMASHPYPSVFHGQFDFPNVLSGPWIGHSTPKTLVQPFAPACSCPWNLRHRWCNTAIQPMSCNQSRIVVSFFDCTNTKAQLIPTLLLNQLNFQSDVKWLLKIHRSQGRHFAVWGLYGLVFAHVCPP